MSDFKQELMKLGFTLEDESDNATSFVKDNIILTIKLSENKYKCYTTINNKKLYLKTNTVESLLKQVSVLLDTCNKEIV